MDGRGWLAVIVLCGFGLIFIGAGIHYCARQHRLERDGITVRGRCVDKYSQKEGKTTYYRLVVEYGTAGDLPPIEAERKGGVPGKAGRAGLIKAPFPVSRTKFEEVSVYSPIDVRCLPSDPWTADVEMETSRSFVPFVIGGCAIAAAAVFGLVSARSRRRKDAVV